ncbi:MAG TPA: nucleotidyltransferase domain-containing protein [Anaerolineae bacterium]|nr:nucleotidyltransferase domain-containing protein [Anaerolineae bacterium]
MAAEVALLEKLNVDVDEVLSNLELPIEPYTIFISGSVTEGFGHALSDLDVFVIFPKQVQVSVDIAWENHTISNKWIANWRLDIENWEKAEILKAARRLQEIGIEDWDACRNAKLADIHIAHRMRGGIPIQSEDNFRELQRAFDYDHFSQILVSQRVAWFESVAEDVVGAIDSKQAGLAWLTVREAVGLALDAYIASKGETNTKAKWRFAKLSKLGETEVLERYWSCELPRLDHREAIIDFAKQSLDFANELMFKAQKDRPPA